VANIPKVWNGTAFIELEAAATVAPAASTTVVGIVQLTDSTSSTSTTTAATPNSVKSAYDLAGTAIPKNTVTAAGDILYASGSATVARLGIGTASQVLSVSGGVPAWTTPAAGGGMTLIATATPSAATSLAFTSIPTTYKHLQLVWFDVFQSVTSPWWGIRFNNDSTAGQYFARQRAANTSNSNATMIGTNNQNAPIGATTTSGTVYNSQSKGTLDIFLYTESQNKFFRMVSINDPSDAVAEWTGVYLGTAAVTSLDFVRSSTQTITGKFYLYGVS
jgi:hypothetical protein